MLPHVTHTFKNENVHSTNNLTIKHKAHQTSFQSYHNYRSTYQPIVPTKYYGPFFPTLLELYKYRLQTRKLLRSEFEIIITCHLRRMMNFFSLSVHNFTQLIILSGCANHLWCRHCLAVNRFLLTRVYIRSRKFSTYTIYHKICKTRSTVKTSSLY